MISFNSLYIAYYLFTEKIISYCDNKVYEHDMMCIEFIIVPNISYWIKVNIFFYNYKFNFFLNLIIYLILRLYRFVVF